MLSNMEKKFGLPPLGEGIKILTGPTGKRLSGMLDKLETLAQNEAAIKDVIVLLQLVKELDEQGTLARLDSMLKQLGPLTKGATAKMLVEKLDKLEKLLSFLLKEEKGG